MKWKKLTATLLACGMFLSNGLLHIPPKKPLQSILKKEKKVFKSTTGTTNPTQKARAALKLAKTHDERKVILHGWLKNYMKEKGYTPQEYQMVKYIWSKESAFKWKAENFDAGSGNTPKGIPQVRWSKWGKWNRDPFKQMHLGLKYIDSRYDSVEHAYNTKRKTGEY